MRFKSIDGAQIYITVEGKICIQQYSFEFGKDVFIYLTFNQFIDVAGWAVDNKNEIEELWNDGIGDDDDFEA